MRDSLITIAYIAASALFILSLGGLSRQETARRGERCLYLAFEESPQQLMRNMRTIGVDLEPPALRSAPVTARSGGAGG